MSYNSPYNLSQYLPVSLWLRDSLAGGGLIGWMPLVSAHPGQKLIFVTADQPISLSRFPYLQLILTCSRPLRLSVYPWLVSQTVNEKMPRNLGPGVYGPLPTFFDDDQEINYDDYRKHLLSEFQAFQLELVSC